MSDQNEKNLNQPEEGQDDFSSMSIDELIASTKEEIARIDQMMGTSRQVEVSYAVEGRGGPAPVKISRERMPLSDFLNTFGLTIEDVKKQLK